MNDVLERRKLTAKVMGTFASLHVDDSVDDGVIDLAWSEALDLLVDIERRFSTFRRDSEISRINRGDLHLLDASAEVLEVMDACTWLEHESNGAFRARRPDGSLDPAGFVKGWAAERAGRILSEHGLSSWYLNVGGDIQTSGLQASGQRWRIGVVSPSDRTEITAWFDIPENFAVATSGTGARGAHLWDGRDGTFVDRLASITVVGPHLMWADALATAAFAMGDDGLAWLARYPLYQGFSVCNYPKFG
ncbi:MAG: FAD:protein FMN transferase [Acidobacteria bacterium]|nr:FAD:protein FMN transferase [Acidobacteriota bacterium]